MPKHFKKVKEDFVCDNCGYKIIGTGYTNHCPSCLYSKHVDNLVPGDRNSICKGIMIPIGLQVKGAKLIIFHRCLKCSKITRNRSAADDNPHKIVELSAKPLK